MNYLEASRIEPLLDEASQLVAIFIATTKKLTQQIEQAA